MLDAPFTLPCGLVLPHRLAFAPLTNTQSQPDGTLSEEEIRWLERRAAGGWSLLPTAAAFVSEQGHAWEGQLGIDRDALLPGLRDMATRLRAAGAHGIVQLHHAGALATVARVERISAVASERARAATEADLVQVRADYVAAARRAQEAGFAGVEIHGANGYLFTQFLAPNERCDAYGGPLAHRARLLRETLQAVRAAVRPDFAVGVRISPVDVWQPRGLRLEDSLQVGRWLAEDGADWIHLSLDQAWTAPRFEESDTPVAQAFRAALPAAVPILAAGGVWTAADAERAHAAGADVVVVGRAGIIHPDWPRDIRDPAFQTTRPPWPQQDLRAVAVSPRFLSYLLRFPGLVEGGAPPR